MLNWKFLIIVLAAFNTGYIASYFNSKKWVSFLMKVSNENKLQLNDKMNELFNHHSNKIVRLERKILELKKGSKESESKDLQ